MGQSLFLRSSLIALAALSSVFGALFPFAGNSAPGAVELLVNGGFEQAVEGTPVGWLASRGRLSQVDSPVHSGSYAASFEATSTGAGGFYQVAPISPGRLYTFSGFVVKNNPELTSIALRLSWYASADGSGSELSSVDSVLLARDDTSYVFLATGTAVAPLQANSVKARVIVQTAAIGALTYFDNLSLTEEGPTPTPSPTATATPLSTSTPTYTPTATPTATPTTTSIATATPTVSPAPSGLLKNASFEQGDEGWTTVRGSLSPVASPVHGGGYAASLSGSGPSLSFYQTVPVSEGDTYRLQGYAWKDLPNLEQVFLEVAWYAAADGAGPKLGNDRSTSLTANGPAYVFLDTGDAVAPPGSRSARLSAVAQVASGEGAAFFDDLALFRVAVGPTPTPTATSTPTPTASPSATPTPLGTTAKEGDVVINEVQYDPIQSGNDASYEWLELYNRTDNHVILQGWQISDNSESDALPFLSLPAGGFAIVAASHAFHENFPAYSAATVYVTDDTIGNGLSNSGDRLRLADSSGRIIDALSYSDDATHFNPPVPAVAPGHSLERRPAGQLAGGALAFIDNIAPSPGVGLAAPTPTPSPTPFWPARVFLNEVLPAPKNIDWNGDGELDSGDEWIELYNAESVHVGLEGWTLGDASGKRYSLPTGAGIAPRGYAVFFGSQTRLALNNSGDTVSLLQPDGAPADEFTYGTTHYDESFAREGDGFGDWSRSTSPSPGAPNSFPASPAPGGAPPAEQTPAEVMPIGQARLLAPNTKVSIRGQFSAPFDLLGQRTAYVRDDGGAMAVYLERGGVPSSRLGDWALLTGVTGERRGERTLRVYAAYDMVLLGAGAPPSPRLVGTSDIGEATEAELVQVSGQITRQSGQSLYIDDGSGPARIFLADTTGLTWPVMEKGAILTATGIVSQWDTNPPLSEGFRLMPRYPDDFQAVAGIQALPSPSPFVVPSALPSAGDRVSPLLGLAGLGALLLGLGLRKSMKGL